MVVIETKLYIPSVHSELIERPHLKKRLDEGLNCKLTLITAPPGYGKTTILSEWTKDVNVPIAWVSLDQGDTNWVRFWIHLVAALKQAVPAFDARAVQRFVLSDDSGESLIAAMINGMNRLTGQVVIVWDDFHHVDDPSILRGVTYLLQRLPTHVHLFITSRVQLSLPLSKMRVGGELNVLMVDDLRFGFEESMDFFDCLKGVRLSCEETAAVLERTEGWITGMRLAAISLNGKKERSVIFEEMTGGQREIADYFFEEVLSNHSVIMQQFLLQTSILDRMNGELCEVVTGIENSTAFIQEFELNNLFIVPLDAGQEWYRYHHLFQEFLYTHLKTYYPEQVETLHSRAGRWLEENHLLREAMEQYLAGTSYEEALHLSETMLPKLLDYERTTIHKWLNQIPNELLFKTPMLYLTNLASLFLSGHVDVATEKYWWAENQLKEVQCTLSPIEVEEFQSGLLFLVAFRAYLEQDFETSIQYSKEYVQRDPTGSFFVGFGTERSGYHPLWEIHVTVGGLRTADKILSDLLDIWSETENVYFVAHLCIDYGKLLYEWNRLEEAEQYLLRAVEVGKTHGNRSIEVIASLLLLRVYMADSRLEITDRLLRALTEQVDARSHPNLAWKIDWFRAMRNRSQGKVKEAGDWLETSGLRAEDEIPYSLVEEYNLFACLLAEQGKTKEAKDLLEYLLYIARREGRQSDVIRLLLHKSLVLVMQDNIIYGMTTLEEALHLAEPEGYIRTFLDAGEPLMELLGQYVEARQNQHYRQSKKVSLSYVKQLLRLRPIPQEEMVYAISGEESVHKLTNKEMQVLQLMSTGIPNKEIASKLSVSLSTVKTHINNIYRKLQVNNRMTAVQRATRIGLLKE